MILHLKVTLNVMAVPEVLQWLMIVVLVLLSGLFSGLNLGLMGLDPVDLEVVMSGVYCYHYIQIHIH